jgi:hypothetical protein
MATAGDWLVNNEFEVKLERGRKREDKGSSPWVGRERWKATGNVWLKSFRPWRKEKVLGMITI